jgi:hypothetical protein
VSLFTETVDLYFVLQLFLGLAFCVVFFQAASAALAVLGLPSPLDASRDAALRTLLTNASGAVLAALAFWFVGHLRRRAQKAAS